MNNLIRLQQTSDLQSEISLSRKSTLDTIIPKLSFPNKLSLSQVLNNSSFKKSNNHVDDDDLEATSPYASNMSFHSQEPSFETQQDKSTELSSDIQPVPIQKSFTNLKSSKLSLNASNPILTASRANSMSNLTESVGPTKSMSNLDSQINYKELYSSKLSLKSKLDKSKPKTKSMLSFAEPICNNDDLECDKETERLALLAEKQAATIKKHQEKIEIDRKKQDQFKRSKEIDKLVHIIDQQQELLNYYLKRPKLISIDNVSTEKIESLSPRKTKLGADITADQLKEIKELHNITRSQANMIKKLMESYEILECKMEEANRQLSSEIKLKKRINTIREDMEQVHHEMRIEKENRYEFNHVISEWKKCLELIEVIDHPINVSKPHLYKGLLTRFIKEVQGEIKIQLKKNSSLTDELESLRTDIGDSNKFYSKQLQDKQAVLTDTMAELKLSNDKNRRIELDLAEKDRVFRIEMDNVINQLNRKDQDLIEAIKISNDEKKRIQDKYEDEFDVQKRRIEELLSRNSELEIELSESRRRRLLK